MGSGKAQTVGYRYYFGIFMGVCRGPVDQLVAIKVADSEAWYGNVVESGRVQISAPELFGGDNKEGGIVGPLDVMMGDEAQTAPPALATMLGGLVPGFRGVLSLFFDGQIGAMNPYPKPWRVRVRRALKGWDDDAAWYPEKAVIMLQGANNDLSGRNNIAAMNPAHILLECLTNKTWGRGLDSTALDVTSFEQAADTLHTEGFGLCLKWSRKDDIQSFVASVIDHIGATLYTDRGTGKLTLKLVRYDYIPSTLPLYDVDSGLLAVNESTVQAFAAGVNDLTVNYIDPVTNEQRSQRIHNLASVQSQGALNSMTKSYPGLPTAELALRVAQRDLRALGGGLRRFRLEMDRRAWRIAPGSVFRIRDLSRGIGETVLRAAEVEDGILTSGRMRITALQDVFAFPLTAYVAPQPPPPTPQPVPELRDWRALEIPYRHLHAYTSRADFNAIEPTTGYLGTVVEKPTPRHAAYDISVKDGAVTPDDWTVPD